MEIKRKKISIENIFEAEQTFAGDIKNLCGEKEAAFLSLGYELDLEFSQKDHEDQRIPDVFETEGEKKYESGYVSRAVIKVKRKKTEEELAEDARLAEANRAMIDAAENEAEIEQLENDEKLRISDAELKRSVAFTEVMLVRAYKSFWTEWVCLGNSTKQLEADLDEFIEVLTQRQAENA
jgi:hypothetical protein